MLTAAAATLAIIGCGESTQTAGDTAQLVEDAAAAAALADGEDVDLSESLASYDLDAAAEEDVDFADLEGEGYARDCRIVEFRRRVIDEYDADGDGALDADEREALRADFDSHPFRRRWYARYHRVKRLAWIYDRDDSFDLDETERDELRMDLETRCMNRQAWLLDAYDADESGDLGDDEWQTALDDLAESLKARHDEFVARYDANDDGFVDPIERIQARIDRLEVMVALHEKALERYDENGDGRLSTDERDALRDALAERVQGQGFLDRIDPGPGPDPGDDDDDDKPCRPWWHRKCWDPNYRA
jgi:Ca2+-binding EF-hand superfamily protein